MKEKIFGILASNANENSSNRFGTFTHYLRDLVERAMSKQWIVYVFSAKDILKQRNIIWGWSRAGQKWQRAFFPIPNVCYIRKLVLSEVDNASLDWLTQTNNVQFINQPHIDNIAGDQWRVIQIALSQPTLITKIPDTNLVRDGYGLVNFLEEVRTAFIRSRSNLLKNQFAYLKREKGIYRISVFDSEKNKTYRSKSILEVVDLIKRIFGDAMIQPYFKKVTIGNHVIKFRTVWQKKIYWQETFATVMLSGENLSDGSFFTAGLLDSFVPILENELKLKLDNLKFQIQSTASSVIELFSNRVTNISELAIDLWIDQKGKIIFDSVSTYAGVLALNKLRNPELKLRFIDNTLDYAQEIYDHSFSLIQSPVQALGQKEKAN